MIYLPNYFDLFTVIRIFVFLFFFFLLYLLFHFFFLCDSSSKMNVKECGEVFALAFPRRGNEEGDEGKIMRREK